MSWLSSVSSPRDSSKVKLPETLSAPGSALLAAMPKREKAPLPEKLPSYIKDHRKRLRARFIEGGAAAMPDYELLELVLFRAIPRQDVKPLARLLLDTFGDFNRVVSASPARLTASASRERS